MFHVTKVGNKQAGGESYSNNLLSRSKMFLICWCPDSARVKKKMLYSSTFDTLKKAFVGVHKVAN